MAWSYGWISVTRVTGLAAYAISLGTCIAAWKHCRSRGRSGHLFAGLAAVQLLLLLDMAFDWRWKLHEYGMRAAMAEGVYWQRRLPQLVVLAVLACVLLCSAGVVLWRLRHRMGAALAVTGTVLSVGIWASEAVSYHYLDLVLYRRVGEMMLVSFIWIFLAMVTSLGIWLDAMQSESLGRRF